MLAPAPYLFGVRHPTHGLLYNPEPPETDDAQYEAIKARFLRDSIKDFRKEFDDFKLKVLTAPFDTSYNLDLFEYADKQSTLWYLCDALETAMQRVFADFDQDRAIKEIAEHYAEIQAEKDILA